MATIANLDVVLGLKGHQSFKRNMLGVTARVGAAAVVFDKLITRGGKIVPVMAAFNRSAVNQTASLNRLRAATGGLVSDFDLMQQANTALTLGSAKNVDQFAEMAVVAQRLGRALGVDATYALNSLNTGIARQSKLLLDNLGIIVKVREGEDFRTAAMRAAREATERLGEDTRTAADAYKGFKVEIGNTVDEIAKLIATQPAIESFFDQMTRGMKAARGEGGSLRNTIRLLFTDMELITGGSFLTNADNPIQIEGVTVGGENFEEMRRRRQLEGETFEQMRRRRQLEGRMMGLPGPGPIAGRFDTRTGRMIGTQDPFLPNGGVNVPNVGALGPNGGVRNRRDGLASAEGIAKIARETKAWEKSLLDVADTVENVLVRSLTKAIMKFEGMNNLLKDIGKSFLASLVGGAVSFGMGKLTGGILGKLIPGFGGGKAAGGPVNAGTAYLVGEQGPELFMPSNSGSIVPNGGMSINVNMSAARNGAEALRDREWMRALQDGADSLKSNGYSFA